MCSIVTSDYLQDFFEMAGEEPRIGITHICLYVAILSSWTVNNYPVPLVIRRDTLMRLAKIYSRHTFNKSMHDLHGCGFIRYYPAKSSKEGSVIYIRAI